MADFEPDRELESLLGARRVAELRQLAAAAPRRATGRRVYILPGIMGSTLGSARKLLPDDLLWFDPVEIALGRMTDLVPPSKRSLEPRGALLFGYLRLKLLLRAAGHDATILPWDWRHGAGAAAAVLARRLATAPEGTALVAHSQGGLVARALLAHPESRRLSRVVQLGTPNRGAFAAVQALRGTYPLVRRLARLDLAHDATELADGVLAKLAGLAELLPDADACERFDPFDARQWPAGPRPDARTLIAAQAVRAMLPPPDARFRLIAGYGRETPTSLRLSRGALEFSSSRAGDGTVPLALACLPGLDTHYSTAAHGELPTDATVGQAILDLLEGGTTSALPTTAPIIQGPRSWRRETLAADSGDKLFWDDLSPPERLDFLHEFVSVAPSPVLARKPGRRAARVPLTLLQAEAVDVRTDALVLALFEQVDPAGATLAVDRALGGIIRDLAAHRALGAAAGQVFVLPVRDRRLPARRIVLAGLGPFGAYDADAQRRAAANALHALALSGVRDCAFVLWGTASGMDPAEAATSLVAGLAEGLAGLEPSAWPRRLSLVSRSAQRLGLAREALESLFASTDAAAVLDLVAAHRPPRAPGRRARPATQDAAYLFAAERGNELQLSLLGPGDKGTALRATQALDRRRLDALLARLGNDLDSAELAEHGGQLGELLLPPAMREALLALRDVQLTLVHDVAASRWPWEAIHVGGHAPAAAASLCRRLAADDLSVARWLESRQARRELTVLLVTNPTDDLPGAAREGIAVRKALQGLARVELTEVSGSQATRSRLLEEFRSGRHDAVHYAGHAFFEPDSPGRSGILCAGGRVLHGDDLKALEALPALMFFNACETGRVRARPARRAAIEGGTGLAEAFLRAGLANYVGTWWPVGDDAALEFARCAYGRLAAGETLGAAVLAARNAVRRLDSGDWANYLHYGGHGFRLKEP